MLLCLGGCEFEEVGGVGATVAAVDSIANSFNCYYCLTLLLFE